MTIKQTGERQQTYEVTHSETHNLDAAGQTTTKVGVQTDSDKIDSTIPSGVALLRDASLQDVHSTGSRVSDILTTSVEALRKIPSKKISFDRTLSGVQGWLLQELHDRASRKYTLQGMRREAPTTSGYN